MNEPSAVEVLYRRIVDGWNSLDAGRVASAFSSQSLMIGYDGTEMHGPTQIANSFDEIFRDHEPGRWVALVQGVEPISDGVQVLRAYAGWFMSPEPDSFPSAVQTAVAVESDGKWRLALLQTTPAAWHGRSDDVADLKERLRAAASLEAGRSP